MGSGITSRRSLKVFQKRDIVAYLLSVEFRISINSSLVPPIPVPTITREISSLRVESEDLSSGRRHIHNIP